MLLNNDNLWTRKMRFVIKRWHSTFYLDLYVHDHMHGMEIEIIKLDFVMLSTAQLALLLLHLPFVRSSDVTFPWSRISLTSESALLVSQKRIFLSKWPLMIVEPAPSVVTRSLQLDPANFVSVQALLLKSHIFNVRSWLPVTIFWDSPTNLPAITLPLWPVSECCK